MYACSRGDTSRSLNPEDKFYASAGFARAYRLQRNASTRFLLITDVILDRLHLANNYFILFNRLFFIYFV